jgi:hypothetical protein
VNPPPPGQLLSLGVGIPNSGIPNPPAPSIAPPGPFIPTTSPSDAQRDFELVTHYMFYDNLSFNRLKDILISPSDFLPRRPGGMSSNASALRRRDLCGMVKASDIRTSSKSWRGRPRN